MYNTYTGGCNILNLQVSRHKTIDVKSNNSKSWDYTNPILPINESRLGNGNSDMGQMMGGSQSSGNGLGGQSSQNQLNKNNMIADHPLLPMPMNMAAAAAAAAAAAGHHFGSNSPFMSQQGQQNAGTPGSSQNPYGNPAAVAAAAAAAVAAQSVTGYSLQSMDTRSAVVQVSNFPDQVRFFHLKIIYCFHIVTVNNYIYYIHKYL